MNILVLGGGLQALSVVRSLKEAGYHVLCLSTNGEAVAWSRYVDKFELAQVLISAKGYLDYICDFLSGHECDVVIPMSDKLAEFLSKNKAVIEQRTRTKCAVPEYGIFSVANDKWKLLQLCEENELPHPKTRPLSLDKLDESAKFVGFPALIKPNISVGARGITLVHDVEELRQKYQPVHDSFGECTLQEYIEQNGRPYYNIMLYRRASGEIVNYTILEIVRYYPVKGGSSSFGRTIKDEELVSICVKTLEKLGWVGFADFDILKTREGEYKIIEINPRVPASLRAAAVSGINFPDIIVRDLMDLPIMKYEYLTGKELRFLGLDIMWLLSAPSDFKTKCSWFKFLGKDLYYQDGGYKDNRAMFSSLWSGIKKAFNSSLRKEKSGL